MARQQLFSNEELGIKKDAEAPVEHTQQTVENEQPKETAKETKETVVETKQEVTNEKQEERVQEAPEEVVTEKKVEAPVETPPVNPFISKVKEKVGEDFDNEDSFLESYLSYKTKLSELENSNKELSEKLDISLQNLDPSNIFASEEIRKYNELIKKYPDKDPRLMSEIVVSNLDEMSDLDVLALETRLSVPNLKTDNQKLRDYLEEKYGDEMTLQIEAAKARQTLKQLSNIELPPALDIEKLRTERITSYETKKKDSEQKWQPLVEELISQSKVNVNVEGDNGEVNPFEYTLSEEAKDTIKVMTKTLIDMGLEPSTDNVKVVKELSQAMAIQKNLPKILKAHTTRELSKYKEKTMAELHNPVVTDPQKPSGNNPDKVKAAQEARIIEAFGKHKRKPLF